jgi:hypothetical protein
MKMNNTLVAIVVIIIILAIVFALFAVPKCRKSDADRRSNDVKHDWETRSANVKASNPERKNRADRALNNKPAVIPEIKAAVVPPQIQQPPVRQAQVDTAPIEGLPKPDEKKPRDSEKVDWKKFPPAGNTPPIQNTQPRFPVLSGSLEHMFDIKTDVESEFGITDQQLNSMALDYKKRLLSQHKESVSRNRGIRRSEIELAERNLRESVKAQATGNQRLDMEEFTQNMMKQSVMREAASKSVRKRDDVQSAQRTFITK